MAGDWIKVEKATLRKPEVLRLATILKIHPDHAYGLCSRFWCWCDDNLSSGHLPGVTGQQLDMVMGHDGFSSALISVGWLQAREGSLVIPNFNRHLSQSAKSRALAARRQDKHRSRKSNAPSVTKTSPEKRREEKNKDTPLTPQGGEVGGGFSEEIQAKAAELYNQYGKRRWGDLWKNDTSCEQGKRDLREISSRIHAIPTAYEKLKAYFANPPPDRPTSEKLWQIFKHLDLEASSKPKEKLRPSQVYRDYTAERLAGQFST